MSRDLQHPDETLEVLYAKDKNGLFEETVISHFSRVFADRSRLEQVPALDYRYTSIDALMEQSRPLVRFRGMVQSTDQEVYQAVRSVGNGQTGPGGWGLSEKHTTEAEDLFELDPSNLDDRQTAWAISVPGETDWMASIADNVPLLPESDRQPRASALTHKHPLPSDPASFGVHLKLYCDAGTVPKLTEVHTFVGILTNEPLISADETETASSVPTVHVLFHTPATSSDLSISAYPLAPFPSPPNGEEAPSLKAQEGETHPERVRSALIKWIASAALGGDILAAEWVLLSIISRTFSRTPAILPLALTLAHFPLPASKAEPSILHALRLLLPSVIDLPLSIPTLNTSHFAPRNKDEDLHSGLLQLPEGTTVLVSDFEVAEGTVTEQGVRNINALKQCVTDQTLLYSFPFAEYPFKTSINFLVLAQGKKSPFIETPVSMRLEPASPSDSLFDEVQSPDDDILASFRALVCGARVGKIEIADDVSEFIQEDFVRERRDDKTITSDDLILRMSIARLLALSLHESHITREIWERSKRLDQERKKRNS